MIFLFGAPMPCGYMQQKKKLLTRLKAFSGIVLLTNVLMIFSSSQLWSSRYINTHIKITNKQIKFTATLCWWSSCRGIGLRHLCIPCERKSRLSWRSSNTLPSIHQITRLWIFLSFHVRMFYSQVICTSEKSMHTELVIMFSYVLS